MSNATPASPFRAPCGCGFPIPDRATWLSLRFIGQMTDGLHGFLELRQCVCNSTIAVEAFAENGCYGCGGSGVLCGGKCPCVAVCYDCDEPFAWARDDYRERSGDDEEDADRSEDESEQDYDEGEPSY